MISPQDRRIIQFIFEPDFNTELLHESWTSPLKLFGKGNSLHGTGEQ